VIKRGTIILVVGCLAFLGACGNKDEGPEPTVTRIPNAANAPIAGSPAAAAGAASPSTAPTGLQTGPIEVDMADIKFEPAEITIPANTDVTINLANKGAATHNFNIDELNIHSGDYEAGKTGSVTINAAPGDYQYYCAIPGHKEAGMVGTVHVVEGGAAPPASPPAAASPAASPAASAAATPVAGTPAVQAGPAEVALLDVHFEPKELTIAADTPVTINLVNKGKTDHTFDVDALNVHSGPIKPGETRAIAINAPAGEYEYYCAIPGHKQAGMVGTLKVVAGAAPPAGTPAATAVASPAASPGASPVASPAASPVALLTGDVTRGEAAAAVCLGCHSIDGSAKVGPTWKGLYGSQVELESGETVTADAAYLHESIADPTAKVVKGFKPVMPDLGLDEQTIADLIAYIESLKE